MKTALLAIALACSGIASAGNAPDAPALTMTEQGIGPITAATPFDADVIRKLLPSLEVKRDVSSTEGEELPVLLVSDKRGLLLTIHPDEGNRIFSVVLENDRVANALGHRTGQTHQHVFQGRTGECYPGMEEYSGTALCVAPNARRIHYLFGGQWNGADGQLPPPKVLRTWKITSIVWKP